MPGEHNFEHLPLLLRYEGRARLQGGGRQSPQTLANRNARQAHSAALLGAAQSLSANWRNRRELREDEFPTIPAGIPILLQVDPSLDLDVLREKFSFENMTCLWTGAQRERSFIAREQLECLVVQRVFPSGEKSRGTK